MMTTRPRRSKAPDGPAPIPNEWETEWLHYSAWLSATLGYLRAYASTKRVAPIPGNEWREKMLKWYATKIEHAAQAAPAACADLAKRALATLARLEKE